MEIEFGWKLVLVMAKQSIWYLSQPAADTHKLILNSKKPGVKRQWLLRALPAGRSQLTLLLYMCLLPLLIPIGWSNLLFLSLFANHPMAAATQSIAATSTGDCAQRQLLTARGATSPTDSGTLVPLSGRSTHPTAHWALRSITFTSRSLLVQMRSWHGKNTQDS